MKKSFKCTLCTALVLLLLLTVGCSSNIANKGQDVVVKIESGMNSKDIADLLVIKGVLPSNNYFALMSRFYSLDKSLQAGFYKIKIGMGERELIQIFSKGAVLYNTLTIPEGMYVPQIAELLEQNQLGKKDAFLAVAKDYAPYDYMQTDNPNVKYKAEGFLFPSTYNFPFGASEEDILKIMVSEFNKRLTAQLREQASNAGMDVRTLLTKASLVEKDARFDVDRPIIAGVFENRLKIDMPLQCDATVQYELGYAKFPLLFSDLKIDSSYNTYLHIGLPPGPIGNPGMASIQAVLNYTPSDYLFFVADKNGKYYYTKTFDEHQHIIDTVDLGY